MVGEGSGGVQQEDDATNADMPPWDVIAEAMGADDFLEPRKSTRGKGPKGGETSKGKAVAEDDDVLMAAPVHDDDEELLMSDEATDDEDLEDEDLGDFDSDNELESEEAN